MGGRQRARCRSEKPLSFHETCPESWAWYIFHGFRTETAVSDKTARRSARPAARRRRTGGAGRLADSPTRLNRRGGRADGGNEMLEAVDDDQWLYSSLADDPDLADLAELFVMEMPAKIAGLVALASAKNWPQLARESHQLKGAAGSYGFDSLTPCAARLETAARDRRPEDRVRAALAELTAVCKRLRAGSPFASG